MIKLKVLRKYTDTSEMKKKVVGDILEVSEERGLELLEKSRLNNRLGFEVLRIDKLSSKKNGT